MPSPLGPLTPGSGGGGSHDSASIRKRLAIEDSDSDDVEEGQLDDGDGDGGESAWVVDTQPRKSKRKRKVAAREREEERHSSPLPPFMAVDTGGDVQGDAPDATTAAQPTLLLPDHVQIQDRQAQSNDSPPPPDPEAEGHLGDFTQLDADTSGMTRYYQAAEAQERKQLRTCEICGEKGHVKRECSHLLCASCGAMDEHTTRDCPVGVSCFRCGQRGHRRNECTADLRRGQHRTRDCTRCGSLNHNESTCPTYWRIYVYVDEDGWQDFRAKKARDMEEQREEEGGRLRTRRADSDMDTDDDDDRYAPPGKYAHHRQDWDPAQRWCYNCTAKGTHWGDDCPLPRRAHGRNGEPSIFSEFISMSGPFAYRLAPPPAQRPTSQAHPTADMYDVSVGPNTSMHIAGGSRRPLSIEEEVDRIFARAPRGPRSRVERGRDYQPPPPPRPQQSSSGPVQIRGTARGSTSMGTSMKNQVTGGGKARNPRVKEHSSSWGAQSDSDEDAPIELSSSDDESPPPTLTSRQLQSQRDKAAHQKRLAEQRNRGTAFGPFSTDGDDLLRGRGADGGDLLRGAAKKLAIDPSWQPPKESNKSKKSKGGDSKKKKKGSGASLGKGQANGAPPKKLKGNGNGNATPPKKSKSNSTPPKKSKGNGTPPKKSKSNGTPPNPPSKSKSKSHPNFNPAPGKTKSSTNKANTSPSSAVKKKSNNQPARGPMYKGGYD